MSTILKGRLGLAILWLGLFICIATYSALWATQSPLDVVENPDGYTLVAQGLGRFHTSSQMIQNARIIQPPNSPAKIALWEEKRSDGVVVPFFAISLDGSRIDRLQPTSYEVLLRYAEFDPSLRQPDLPDMAPVKDSDSEEVYIVQFVAPPLEEFRREIRALGGTLYKFIANHAYLVKMSASVRQKVGSLPFVRWIGPYSPAYRLEEFLLASWKPNGFDLPETRYNIQVFERGPTQQERVAKRIQELGGVVHETHPEGFRLEATLTAQALLKVAQMMEVQFIDRWGPPEADVTTAREIGGAVFLEEVGGFTGTGVTGEVMDLGCRVTHMDFRSRPLLIHGVNPTPASHGTNTTGIVFGDGAVDVRGRGLLPGGQGIVAVNSEARRRYEHTAELVQDPYNALFQSNSWGGSLTTQYTTVTAEMDDMLFINDLVITQSQSNTGNRSSRPEAWAKNIVSVGGVRHRGTLTMDDDCWCQTGSIGPAADGRIKPDFAHFYDMNFTPHGTSDTAYNPNFGGTSAATPIVAGYFGLFFEMWHHGVFGNPTDLNVFLSRPHMTTAKAMLVNTAKPWYFEGPSADLTRTHQGWGMPDLQLLLDLSHRLLVVDQTDILRVLETKTYRVMVGSDDLPLRATLVYADPSGTTSSSQHRINDLTLKVTSPSQVVYWGNQGLLTGIWSESGGEADTKNTVENVFIETPEPGLWTIEVIASEINEDGYRATPEVDAGFSLVVSGINQSAAATK